jgi:hypothetical protein
MVSDSMHCHVYGDISTADATAVSNHEPLGSLCREAVREPFQISPTRVNTQIFLPHAQRQQPSREEWEAWRPLIRELYIDQKMSFSSIALTLQSAYGFLPT